MISGFSLASASTGFCSAEARLIGCSMNSVAATSRASAGVSRMRRHSSAMPSTLSYCSLPSSVAR